MVCLGDYGGEDRACYLDQKTNVPLVEKIEPYIPGAPADLSPIMVSGNNVRGITYVCADEECNDFTIRWILIGQGQKCIEGVPNATPNYSYSLCEYKSETKLRIQD